MQRPTVPSLLIRLALIAHLGLSGCGGSDVTTPPPPPPATASSIQVVSGDAQASPVVTRLPASLVVRVINASGGTVAGAPVNWTVSANGGSLAAASSTTNDVGLATNEWTMGTRAGDNSVTASLSGVASSVTFRGSVYSPSNADS